jgi:hypothetical protein
MPPPEPKQVLHIEKRGGKVVQRAILPVRFVPMTGKAQGR